MAALLIYGLSFYQMRSLLEQVVTGWVRQVAQSRLDAQAMQIRFALGQVSHDALALAQLDGTHINDPEEIWNALSSRQFIREIALHSKSPAAEQWTGLTVSMDNGQTLSSGKKDAAQALLSLCNKKDESAYWLSPAGQHNLVFCKRRQVDKLIQQDVALLIDLQTVLLDLQKKLYVVDALDQGFMGRARVSNKLNGDILPEATSATAGSPHNRDIVLSSDLPDLPLVLGFELPAQEMTHHLQKYFLIIILSMGKDMLLMCIAIALVSRHTTKALRDLSRSTEEITQGNLDTELVKIPRSDEVGRLSRSFRRMRDSLKLHILELQEVTAARQRMESELAIAAQIQQAMLPSAEAAADPRYSMSSLLQPARVVGGDLYDYFHVAEDRICMAIGDVANKGMPAALLMARTLSLIRTLAHQSGSAGALLLAVNRELVANNPECRFVTMFFAILDLSTCKMQYASAGHDAPLLLRDGQVSKLTLETGPALGLEEDASFPQFEISLLGQDIVVMYTDGITEARNQDNEEFSESRLQTTISQQAPAFAADVIRIVTLAHQQFIAQAPQFDDLTLLSMQFHPQAKRRKPAFADWKISLNGQLLAYDQVKPSLAGLLHAQQVSDEVVDDLQLITEEVLVNVLRHGATDQDPASIRLDVHLQEKEVVLDVVDNSHAYNPLQGISQPDLETDFADRPEGGLGLYLVNALADHIDYNYVQGHNSLHIRKFLVKP